MATCSKDKQSLFLINLYLILDASFFFYPKGAALELLVRGADPRLRNIEGETALQSALNKGRNECVELVSDFLRRPTFEPETGVVAGVANSGVSEEGRGRKGEMIGGGAVGAAPEVCRANAIFCLGRRRRRSGARVRPGRGLGIGVGTAGAEVGLGARRGARLHTTNPFAGTPMEAFVLWSIASGFDPFHGEGAYQEEEEEGNQSATGGSRSGGNGGRGTARVWLEYYIRVHNARYCWLYLVGLSVGSPTSLELSVSFSHSSFHRNIFLFGVENHYSSQKPPS